MSLHHVTEEECHQTREDLVVLTPGPSPGSVEAKEDEGILTADDEQDGEKLQVGDQVTNTPEERKELFQHVCWFYWSYWFYFVLWRNKLKVPTLPPGLVINFTISLPIPVP